MTGTTHIAAAVCAALALNAPSGGVVLAGFGGLLCDIDCPTSLLGQKVRFLSNVFEHRSFTHSLLFALICLPLNVWLSLGVLTHIILDMMTPSGVRLLFPLRNRLRFPLAQFNQTNSLFEIILQVVLIISAMYFAFLNSGFGFSQLMEFIQRTWTWLKAFSFN